MILGGTERSQTVRRQGSRRGMFGANVSASLRPLAEAPAPRATAYAPLFRRDCDPSRPYGAMRGGAAA